MFDTLAPRARIAILIGSLAVLTIGWTSNPPTQPVFFDGFAGEDRLVTNAYAHDNPTASDAVTSPVWDVTSGSMFVRDDAAWTGAIDREQPGPRSAVATGSAAFRAFARVDRPGDVAIALRISSIAFVDTEPTNAWDGVHVLLRADGETEFYSISVLRRDGKIVVKRKFSSPSSDAARYETLAMTDYSTLGPGWHDVRITASDRDGDVVIEVFIDDVHVVTAVDNGQYGPPITEGGAVAIRGDNLEFSFDDVTID